MSILVLNDAHLGVKRVAGTTIWSQLALREFVADSLFQCLATANSNKCLFAGDLFDNFTIDTNDIAKAIEVFARAWLSKGKHLWLVAGNHDDSAKGNKMSHFELLCTALRTAFPDLVHVTSVGGYSPGDGWVQVDNVIAVAHHCDQNAFLHTLRSLKHLYVDGNFVIVHANFDNGFAARSDHSLNVDREMAAWVTELGAKLLFAHEHQPRVMMDGNVIIMGNQWPTSIADCIGNEAKFGHVISDTIQPFETWNVHNKHGFGLMDWHQLGEGLVPFEGFIRVTGDATAEEASTVMTTISRFRMKSKAMVVTNHVTIDGIAAAEDDEEEIEIDNSVFNLMDFIKDRMSERQFKLFCDLKEKNDAA